MNRITVENIATLVCTTILILGLFYMTGSWWSMTGTVLLLNLYTSNPPQG